jgi:hypothetical protein
MALYTTVDIALNSRFFSGYSLRNTDIGSILLARRAGTYAAKRAVMVMSPIDQAHVTVSKPRTSNKKLSTARDAPPARAQPRRIPRITYRIDSLIISHNTPRRVVADYQ